MTEEDSGIDTDFESFDEGKDPCCASVLPALAKNVCATESCSLLRLVLHSAENFIPLWKPNVVLWWKFKKGFPENERVFIEKLFADASESWGDAAPVKFLKKNSSRCDFVIAKQAPAGSVGAQSFLPSSGQHTLYIYPIFFAISSAKQLACLQHELGHIFGLRHTFALETEKDYPAALFGKHHPESIMNYHENQIFTDDDRNDLKTLYEQTWSGKLTKINNITIKLCSPYHESVDSTPVVTHHVPLPPASYVNLDASFGKASVNVGPVELEARLSFETGGGVRDSCLQLNLLGFGISIGARTEIKLPFARFGVKF